MSQKFQIPRRTFLRGLGATIALPLLDAMRPAAALAGAAPGQPPVRMAFFFVPNGAHMPDWTPTAEGADFDLPWILEPLQPYKQDLLVLSGLAHDHGRSNGDGGGDHARSAASWLTGAQPLKNEGSQIRLGVSADQVAAQGDRRADALRLHRARPRSRPPGRQVRHRLLVRLFQQHLVAR